MIEDESGLSLIPLMGRTWSPVGETPLIEYNFNWKHLSIKGGITLNGSIHFKVHA
ncbi:MAG: hypothetical protein ACYC7D_15780 [Nitrososphaerales archaeon]